MDITSLVMAWLTGKPNYGLVIKPAGRLSGRAPETQYGFYSREYEDVDKQPHLLLSDSGSAAQTGEPGGGSSGDDIDDAVGGIRVVSATYGGNCGVASGNVTSHVARQCNGRSECSYTVDHRVIGDPAFGCAKTYAVQYRCGDHARVIEESLGAEAGLGNKALLLSCANAPAKDSSTDLGRIWRDATSGWHGVWTRRGNSNTFDATWSRGSAQVTGVLRVTHTGNDVFVERIQSSDNNVCTRTGTIAADGRTVTGSQQCASHPGQTFSWSAVIERGSSGS